MIGDKLKELRTDRNLTQQHVADFLKISRAAYANYEAGKREPSLEIIKKLTNFFGISSDVLLENRQKKEKSSDLSGLHGTYFRLAKGAQELGLNDEDVDAILNLYQKHRERNK